MWVLYTLTHSDSFGDGVGSISWQNVALFYLSIIAKRIHWKSCNWKTLQFLPTSIPWSWVRRRSVICCLFIPLKRVSFKKLFMVGENMPEKTFVHKTAVKRISTHWDQENVKKYVLPRTSLPTWSLLQKINTILLQVPGNLVTEK